LASQILRIFLCHLQDHHLHAHSNLESTGYTHAVHRELQCWLCPIACLHAADQQSDCGMTSCFANHAVFVVGMQTVNNQMTAYMLPEVAIIHITPTQAGNCSTPFTMLLQSYTYSLC
jgi:hypothetical protein